MGLANLKELLRDERVPAVAARVALHDGEERHWFTNAEGDYVVSVLTLQHEVPIMANWSFPPHQYSLPQLNDEVLVGFDNGEFEGEAYIICRTSSGVPLEDGEDGELVPGQHIVVATRVEARAASKILLVAPVIEAASAAGEGRKLAFHDELEDLREYVRNQFSAVSGHTHAVAGAATTTIITVGSPGTLPTVPPPTPQGTEILLGE